MPHLDVERVGDRGEVDALVGGQEQLAIALESRQR
jgi:hypothetical protein